MESMAVAGEQLRRNLWTIVTSRWPQNLSVHKSVADLGTENRADDQQQYHLNPDKAGRECAVTGTRIVAKLSVNHVCS